MGQNSEIVKTPRLTVSITGDHAKNLEQLRELLEKRLKQRLSIAQVMKRLTMDALELELQQSA